MRSIFKQSESEIKSGNDLVLFYSQFTAKGPNIFRKFIVYHCCYVCSFHANFIQINQNQCVVLLSLWMLVNLGVQSKDTLYLHPHINSETHAHTNARCATLISAGTYWHLENRQHYWQACFHYHSLTHAHVLIQTLEDTETLTLWTHNSTSQTSSQEPLDPFSRKLIKRIRQKKNIEKRKWRTRGLWRSSVKDDSRVTERLEKQKKWERVDIDTNAWNGENKWNKEEMSTGRTDHRSPLLPLAVSTQTQCSRMVLTNAT